MLITANIATRGDRNEQLLLTVESLKRQVNRVRIYANNTHHRVDTAALSDIGRGNVDVIFGSHDYTDNAKFFFLSELTGDEFYFSCDDDIIYPPNYVEKTLRHIDDFPIVTYHGRILRDGCSNYYGAHKEFFFYGTVDEHLLIDVAGTGVTAIDTRYFCPLIYNSPYKRMSDLVFSLEAKKKNLPIYLAAHQQHWLKPQEVATSIFKERGDQSQQVQLVNELLSQ